MLFPAVQALDGLLQGDLFEPVLIGVAAVTDLIHDGCALAAVGIDGIIERHGVADGLQREDDILPRNVQRLGDLLHRRLAPAFGGQPLLGLQDLVGRVPCRTGDANGAVVAQKSPQLPGDHRNEYRMERRW